MIRHTRQTLSLSARAIELIEKLKVTPWFKFVGTPLEDDSVTAVRSWKDAKELFLSIDWEEVCLDASNRLSMTLARSHMDRYQNWNDIVDATDSHLKSLLESVARRTMAEHNFPDEFEWKFLNTVRGACIETEYSDIVPPAFFTHLARWYLAGHLPCGLTGKRPEEPMPESAQMTDALAMVKKMQHELFSPDTELPDPTLGGSRKLMVF